MATIPYSNPSTYQQWAADLEAYGGLPTTQAETTLISAWEQSENPASQVGSYTSHGGFNALNTSRKTNAAGQNLSTGIEPGSSFIPTFGNITDALAATWATLNQSNYAPELQALQQQSDQGLVNALGSPGHVWGSSPSLVASILKTGPATGSGSGGGPVTGGAGATTASFPGGSLDPLNIPGEIAGAGGGAIASGILGVINTITAPLKAFVVNSALVVFGVLLLAVAVIVIAHSASSGSSTQVIRETVTSSGSSEEEGDEDEEGGEDEDEGEGEHEEHHEETTHTTEKVSTPRSSRSSGGKDTAAGPEAKAMESEAERAPEAIGAAAAA